MEGSRDALFCVLTLAGLVVAGCTAPTTQSRCYAGTDTNGPEVPCVFSTGTGPCKECVDPATPAASQQIVAMLDILPGNVGQLLQTITEWKSEKITVDQAAKRVQPQIRAMQAAADAIGPIDPPSAWVPAYNAMKLAWSKWDVIFDGYLDCMTGKAQRCPDAPSWPEAQLKWDEAAFKANAQLASPHFTTPMSRLAPCAGRGCMYVAIRNNSTATARLGVAEHDTMGNGLDPGLEATLAPNQTKPTAGRFDSCYRATTELYAYRSDGAPIAYDYTPDAKFPVDCKNLAPDSMVVIALTLNGTLVSSVEKRPCEFFGAYQECPIA